MALPTSKYRIIGLSNCEHTNGRIHFTGSIETVSVVPEHIRDPLARNSDLRSHRETAKSMVRQPKLCEDLCWGTLKGYVQFRRKSWVDVSMESDCLTYIFCSESHPGSAETVQSGPKRVPRLPKCSGTSHEAGYNSVLWCLKFRFAEQHVFI